MQLSEVEKGRKNRIDIDRRENRERHDHTLKEMRLAKQKQYDRKRRLEQKANLAEVKIAVSTKEVELVSSTKMLTWYKELSERE